jgi:hypothetical protein
MQVSFFRTLRKVGWLFSWIAVLGCASVGTNFNSSKVASIKKGETTEPALIEMFGKPQQISSNSEDERVLTWIYSESHVKGETFIPFAGGFVGGATTKTKSLVVKLSDGKVNSYTFSGGEIESGSGSKIEK